MLALIYNGNHHIGDGNVAGSSPITLSVYYLQIWYFDMDRSERVRGDKHRYSLPTWNYQFSTSIIYRWHAEEWTTWHEKWKVPHVIFEMVFPCIVYMHLIPSSVCHVLTRRILPVRNHHSYFSIRIYLCMIWYALMATILTTAVRALDEFSLNDATLSIHSTFRYRLLSTRSSHIYYCAHQNLVIENWNFFFR